MVEKVTGSIFTRYEKSARSQQGMAIWKHFYIIMVEVVM